MFEALKSYKVRSQVVSYGTPQSNPRPKGEVAWQLLNLSMARYLTVTASINHVPVSAIIDTGATRSIINVELAQRLALPILGTSTASALTQQVSGTLYRVAELNIGGLVLHNIDISSYNMSAVEGAFAREVPLVVGQDFLATVVLEVDFLHDRARLSPAVQSDVKKAFTKIPIALGKTNLPNLLVGLEGRLQSEAIIDLGSNVLCSISEKFARENSLLDDRPTSTTMNVGAEGVTISRMFSLRELQFGPYVLRNVPTCAVPNWNFSQPVNLGWPCFTAFNFRLDAPGHALWLAADSERLKQPIPRDRSGIGAARLADRLIVRHVAENSPAAQAGLREGDEIVAIDGRAIDGSYPSPSERQGERPVGTRINMTLADGRSLTVVLADYF